MPTRPCPQRPELPGLAGRCPHLLRQWGALPLPARGSWRWQTGGQQGRGSCSWRTQRVIARGLPPPAEGRSARPGAWPPAFPFEGRGAVCKAGLDSLCEDDRAPGPLTHQHPSCRNHSDVMKMVGVTFPCGTDNSTSPLHGHGWRLRSLTVGELRMEAAQGRGPGQGAGRPGVLSRWAGHGAPAPAAVCDRTQVPPAGVCAGVSDDDVLPPRRSSCDRVRPSHVVAGAARRGPWPRANAVPRVRQDTAWRPGAESRHQSCLRAKGVQFVRRIWAFKVLWTKQVKGFLSGDS